MPTNAVGEGRLRLLDLLPFPSRFARLLQLHLPSLPTIDRFRFTALVQARAKHHCRPCRPSRTSESRTGCPGRRLRTKHWTRCALDDLEGAVDGVGRNPIGGQLAAQRGRTPVCRPYPPSAEGRVSASQELRRIRPVRHSPFRRRILAPLAAFVQGRARPSSGARRPRRGPETLSSIWKDSVRVPFRARPSISIVLRRPFVVLHVVVEFAVVCGTVGQGQRTVERLRPIQTRKKCCHSVSI